MDSKLISFEHFQKYVMPYGGIDGAYFPDEASLVDAADLVEQNAGVLALKYELRMAAEGLALAGERSDDYER